MPDEIKSIADITAAADNLASPDTSGGSTGENSAADDASGQSGSADVAGGDKSGAAGVESAYTPNFKFKVLDQEKEVDEWARPFVNKDTEGKFRELYEKAYGLDHVKPKLAEERQARAKVEQDLQGIAGEVREIMSYRENDLDTFFAKTGITEEKVMKWAVGKAVERETMKDLPPEVRNAYNTLGNTRLENIELKKQIERLSSSVGNSSVQARSSELRTELTKPEIASLVSSFDDRLGKPGSFVDLVIRHGKSEFDLTGKDISAEQAVADVLKILGHQTQPPAQGGKPNESTAAVAKVITAPKPTVLPNTGNTGGSATAVKYRSLADLRAKAKEMNG